MQWELGRNFCHSLYAFETEEKGLAEGRMRRMTRLKGWRQTEGGRRPCSRRGGARTLRGFVDEERQPVVLVEVEDLEGKLRGAFAGQASRW